LQLGTGVKPVSTESIFTQGGLQQTENQRDVAIRGVGFFQVLLPDGTTAYTRDGAFQSDLNGQLVTSSGYAVQPAITVPPNALGITIARDGTVSATVPGSTAPIQVGNIQLASFVNPAGLLKMGENLYQETASSGAPNQNAPGTNGLGLLEQNFVETSNVNVVEELVNMIQTQRAYEMNSKSIETSDQMLQRLAQL
jgi:flagellar basal-body rod protein FlgG